MPFAAFQSLLSAGFRLQAREHVMAINAAAFPHMDKKGQKKIAAGLEKQSEMQTPEEAETTSGDVDALRAWGAMEARRFPALPRGTTKPPHAATEDETG